MARRGVRSVQFPVLFALSLLDAGAVLAADVGQRWAVLIGVNDYAEFSDLKYCGRDMLALRDQLVASGFPEKQVVLLHDDATDRKYHPIKANIERQLELVLGLAGLNDLVLVAFSGHGLHLERTSYLCPTEANYDVTDKSLAGRFGGG